MPSRSLQTQLFRVQLGTALVFLTIALVFCWRMTLVDQAIERHVALTAQMNVLHHVIEVADMAPDEAASAEKREHLRSRIYRHLESLAPPLDPATLDLANLAGRALRSGGEEARRLRERRTEAEQRYEDLELAARDAEVDYRAQLVWVGIAWASILVLPLVLAAWPLRLSREVIAAIHRLGGKVELGRRTGDARGVSIDRSDEVGRLGTAIDEMFRTLRQREEEASLARQLWREQQKLGDIINIIGGIAHEIANPLSIILASLEAQNRPCATCTMDGGEASPVREGLSRIHALLQDLTAFTTGDHDVDMVDVNGVIRGVLRIIQLDDRLRASRFEASLEQTLPAVRFSSPLLTLVMFSMMSDTASVLHGTQGELRVVTTADGETLSILARARRTDAAAAVVPDREPGQAADEESSTLVSMSRVVQAYGGTLTAEPDDISARAYRLSLPLHGSGGE
ncbi:MAG: hypothetical protein H7840_06915 [Alphaproteobacteria bacterium]